MKEQEYIKLEGVVDEIVFSSEESGFTVLWLETEKEQINVIGSLFGVVAGEELIITGYYETHAKYGLQFKAQVYERNLPATATAIKKYLASGAIKGIGKVMAGNIVAHFGEETFNVLDESPSRLSEIKGINEKKALDIGEQFKQLFGIRSLMIFLSKFSITPNESVSVYKRFGNFALDLIKENPYILCTDGIFIDFSIADSIAHSYDIPKDSKIRVVAGIDYVLTHNQNNGHTGLPRKSLLQASSSLLQLKPNLINLHLNEELDNKVFYSFTNNLPSELIFQKKLFLSQKYIATKLHFMLTVADEEVKDVTPTINQIEEERGMKYEKLQREAIEKAARHGVFILTGGPGTGKTTTLNGVIQVLELQKQEVLLATPTGRASKRISEVTGREAKTIHRLLEVQQNSSKSLKLEFAHNEFNPLTADVIIIDEMSMVDTLLFEALLRAMKPTSKLIMVGDFNQLPSVGAGNILRDLIESKTIPTIELNFIFRQAAESLIVTNAHKIVQGELPNLNDKTSDFFFMSQSNYEILTKTICDLCSYRLPNKYKLSPFDDIQVLCPQRKGETGMTALNKELQNVLNPKDPKKTEINSKIYTFRLGDKVMQTKNNYDVEWVKQQDEEEEKGKGIFNGDIGKIVMIDKGSKTLAIEFDQRQAFYTYDMANEQLDLAYAITVHKSQGSEFEAVIIPVLGGYDKLYYRNLLYTAVTRAKQILIIVGSKNRVIDMVLNNQLTLRYTGLKAMLQELEDL